MYQTSNTYQSAIKDASRYIRASLSAGDKTYTDETEINTLTLETGGTEKVIGNAYSSKLTAELQLTEAMDIPALGAELHAVFWPDGQDADTVPTAPVVLESVDYDADAGTCTLSGYDRMVRLAEHTAAEINITYPTTIGAYVAAAAALAGLELAGTDWINADIALSAAPNLAGSETCREVVAWAAECALGNAYIDRNGKIAIRSIIPTETKHEINPDLYFESEIGSAYGPINTLVLARLPQNDNVYRSSAADGVQKIALTIADNPFLDAIRDDVIDAMFAQIDGVSVQPYTLDWCGDPALDPGDTITLTDNAGEQKTALYGGASLEFDGGLRATVEMQAPTNETIQYQKASSTREVLRKTQIEVDKSLGEIHQQVQETGSQLQDAIHDYNTKIDQTKSEITQTVSEKIESDARWNKQQSQIDQLKDRIEFVFTDATGQVKKVSDELADDQALLKQYIRFSGALMELGRSDNAFTAQLSNEKLAFLENGTEIAYISNQKLYILDAQVKGRLSVGTGDAIYDIIVRPNKHWSLIRYHAPTATDSSDSGGDVTATNALIATDDGAQNITLASETITGTDDGDGNITLA